MQQDYDVFSSSLKASCLQGGTAIRHDEVENAFFHPSKDWGLASLYHLFQALLPYCLQGGELKGC